MVRLQTSIRSLGVLAVVLLGHPAEGEVILEWVTVGDPGNAPDTRTDWHGGVDHVYQIGRNEVTNAQYTEFLGAVAATDTYELYSPYMAGDTGGISRTGEAGSFTYSVGAGRANHPVSYVSWYDAVRFVNWLHNGQPTGAQDALTTEDGAYTLNGYNELDSAAIVRNPGASVWIPTLDEWYKAAYYKGGGLNAGYWLYATQSDTVPENDDPPGGSNSANYASQQLTDVGAYILSDSAYGTFDQTGNVSEWNETLYDITRGVRGGSYHDSADGEERYLQATQRYADGYPTFEADFIGFRVAAIPEPGTFTLLAVGTAFLFLWRTRSLRRRARSFRE